MPIYEYVCQNCSCRVEKRQRFSDTPLERCEFCGGRLRRLLSPAGIVFKGSGFYATDNRSPSGNGGRGSTRASGKEEAGTSSGAEADGKSGSPEAARASSKTSQ